MKLRTKSAIMRAAEQQAQNLDLEELKLMKSDLTALAKSLNSLIDSFTQRKKNDALAELSQVAQKHGFKLEQLLNAGLPPKPDTRPVVRKTKLSENLYVNPENPAQSWIGRGRMPQWFKDARLKGHSPETMSRQTQDVTAMADA